MHALKTETQNVRHHSLKYYTCNPFIKIFVVIQDHEYRLPLWRLLHLNPWVPGLILNVIHYIFMKSDFINIYFSNSLPKWLGPTLWITKPIKLISREYFISPLGDYEFYLKNICFINTKYGCPTYWGFDHYLLILLLIYQSNLHLMIRSIILSGFRVDINRSREIYYSFDSR